MTLTLPGFPSPVDDAQRTFRALMKAMSFPGETRSAGYGLEPPQPADPATAALLLTLVDAETTMFLAPDFTDLTDWLAFHSGVHLTEDVRSAAFVLATQFPDLRHLNSGTERDPESSATLILQVKSLRSGQRLQLSGPGLERPSATQIDGLPSNFASIWADQQPRFPRGIDLILCARTELMALPRTVSIGGM